MSSSILCVVKYVPQNVQLKTSLPLNLTLPPLLLLLQRLLHDAPPHCHVPDERVHVEGVVQERLVVLLLAQDVVVGGQVSADGGRHLKGDQLLVLDGLQVFHVSLWKSKVF